MLHSFQVFNQTIYTYGFCWIIGFIVGAVYLLIINRKGTVGRLSFIDLTIIYGLCILAIYYGSRAMGYLYNLFFNRNSAFEDGISLSALESLAGGNLLYGGVLASLGVMYFYGKLFKIPFKKIAGIFLPFGALFVFFARLGCFFAGCCYGVECSFGYVFPSRSVIAPAGVRLFPTQMTEAVFGLLLFVFLLFMQRKWREEKAWLALPIFVGSYCTVSFALDFVRADTLDSFLFLTISQWSSLVLIICVAVWFVVYKRRDKKLKTK